MTAPLLPCLRLRVAGVLLCVGLLAPAVVAARARGPVLPVIIAAAPAAPVRVSFLPFDEVREGMTGYGLTVFHGTRIDTFGVRVIGVQRHARVAGGVIIVEVSGHGLEVSAIPQGMSGSPVYLDGKFAGAVAFSWEGALRPIGGLTPAAEMLAVSAEPARPAQEQLGAGVGTAAWPGVRSLGRQLAARLIGEPGVVAPAPTAAPPSGPAWPEPSTLAAGLLPELAAAPADAAGGLRPLGTGLYCRALAGAVTAGRATAATGAAAASALPDLVPGAACAVSLVAGDAELGAIGTVSWRDGDRVGIFGHPLLQSGAVDLPLAGAEVLTVFPSRQMSFKMGDMGAVVGAIHHDQRSGLAGRIGDTAPVVPVTVAVTRPAGVERYAFTVARDPRLTPQLVYWCLYNALLARGDDLTRQTIRFRIATDWRRGDGRAEACAQTGLLVGPNSAAEVAPEWSGPLQALFDNRHEPLTLAGVDAALDVQPQLDVAVIAAVAAAPTARAGETWPVAVRLLSRRGEARIVHRALALPSRLPPGDYRLVVASAHDIFALEMQRAPERFADRSLAATLELARAPRSVGDLELVLYGPARGVTVDGRELPNLPGSVADALRGPAMGRVAPTLVGIALRERVPDGPALEGGVVLSLTILPAAAAVTTEEHR